MIPVWSYLSDEKNRQFLSWIGGGVTAVIIALWTAYTWIWSHPEPDPGKGGCATGSVHMNGHAHYDHVYIDCKFGFTLDNHVKYLTDFLNAKKLALQDASLSPFQHHMLNVQIDNVKTRLAEPQKSYDDLMHEMDNIVAQSKNTTSEESLRPLNEAIAYLEKGDVDQAKSIFSNICKVQRLGVQDGDQKTIDQVARADFELGRIAFAQLDWGEAKSRLKEADALVPFHGEYRTWYVKLITMTGDYAEALRLDKDNIARVGVLSGEDSVNYASAMNQIAGDEVNLRLYKDADRDFQRSLRTFQNWGNDSGQAMVYSNLASIATQAETAAAGEYYADMAIKKGESSRIPTEKRDMSQLTSSVELARYYLNLARYKIDENKVQEAESLTKRAIELDGEVESSESVEGSFFALQTLSRIQMDEGHCAQASATIDQAGKYVPSGKNSLTDMLIQAKRIISGCTDH